MEEFLDLYAVTFSNVRGGWEPIYPRLKDLIRSYENHRFNLVSKARQVGLTTSMRLYSLYKMMETPRTKVLYFCNSRHQGEEFIMGLNRQLGFSEIYQNEYLSNRREVVLTNGSSVKMVTSVDNTIGNTADLILMDEFAFMEERKKRMFYDTSTTVLNPGGRMIIGSTPNGTETFYDLWTGTNSYTLHWLPYDERPEFNNERWYQDQLRHYNDNQPQIEAQLHANFMNTNNHVIVYNNRRASISPDKYLRRHKFIR